MLYVLFNCKHREYGIIVRNWKHEAGQVQLLTAPVSLEGALH